MMFPELNTIIEEMRKIEPRKWNLADLKRLNAKGTEIATIAAFKLSEIYQEEDRLTRENRELSFTYDRTPFEELKKEMQEK